MYRCCVGAVCRRRSKVELECAIGGSGGNPKRNESNKSGGKAIGSTAKKCLWPEYRGVNNSHSVNNTSHIQVPSHSGPYLIVIAPSSPTFPSQLP